MGKSKIQWTDRTWSPVTGCTKVSEACTNCYAERNAKRMAGRFGYPADEPFRVTLHHDRLEQPLRWRKPQLVFVCSMSDLFHPDVPQDFREQVFDVAHQAGLQHGHVFQFLTKRETAMQKSFELWLRGGICGAGPFCRQQHPKPHVMPDFFWLGVTVENQPAVERVSILLQTQAAVRFVSVEPMLGLIDFEQQLGEERVGDCGGCSATPVRGQPYCQGHDIGGIDWIICGGESGPGARPLHPDWVRNLRDQCVEADVPFFFKQWGEWVTEDQSPEDIVLPGHARCPWTLGNGHVDRKNATYRVGKKAAGRELDGTIWDQFPVNHERSGS